MPPHIKVKIDTSAPRIPPNLSCPRLNVKNVPGSISIRGHHHGPVLSRTRKLPSLRAPRAALCPARAELFRPFPSWFVGLGSRAHGPFLPLALLKISHSQTANLVGCSKSLQDYVEHGFSFQTFGQTRFRHWIQFRALRLRFERRHEIGWRQQQTCQKERCGA